MKYDNIDQMPILIKELYAIIHKLEEHFPSRHFTPDGHLVGSIGEVLAAHDYDLELLPASAETHDAKTLNGKWVQIKATQSKNIGLRSQPDYLLVLKILPTGEYEEIYNGPGALVWENCRKMQSNGQCSISVSKLRNLMNMIDPKHQIPKVKK